MQIASCRWLPQGMKAFQSLLRGRCFSTQIPFHLFYISLTLPYSVSAQTFEDTIRKQERADSQLLLSLIFFAAVLAWGVWWLIRAGLRRRSIAKTAWARDEAEKQAARQSMDAKKADKS